MAWDSRFDLEKVFEFELILVFLIVYWVIWDNKEVNKVYRMFFLGVLSKKQELKNKFHIIKYHCRNFLVTL